MTAIHTFINETFINSKFHTVGNKSVLSESHVADLLDVPIKKLRHTLDQEKLLPTKYIIKYYTDNIMDYTYGFTLQGINIASKLMKETESLQPGHLSHILWLN